jgi:hypothetical protein
MRQKLSPNRRHMHLRPNQNWITRYVEEIL